MTMSDGTICTLVQTFPILLIIAQNNNRCLKTPLVYKPPSPTPSPEYYEALEALVHNIFGHSHHGGHSHGCGYGHEIYGYGKKIHGNDAVSPCHTYGYPSSEHDSSHTAYPGTAVYSGTTYPGSIYTGSTYPGTAYPGSMYPGSVYSGTKYPATVHSGTTYPGTVYSGTTYPGAVYNEFGGYPTYGYKKISPYNMSGTHKYKGTYAPTQVYNLNHKYKVVVKKNRKRRPQKLQCFPYHQDYRHFQKHPGFNNNYPQHNQDYHGFGTWSQPLTQYYDRYGRPVYSQQNYQYRPNQENQPLWSDRPGSNTKPNGPDTSQYNNYPFYNGEQVKFPGEGLPTSPTSNYEYQGEPIASQGVNFPDGNNYNQPLISEPSELPPLTPVAVDPPPTTLPSLTPVPSEQVFTSAPVETTLPPLTPASSEESNYGSALSTEASTLPPLTPVPSSESRSSVNFGSSETFTPSGFIRFRSIPRDACYEPCQVDGVYGSCIPVLTCESYAKLLVQARSDPQVVTQLRKAHCGFEGNLPKVCCPASNIPDQPPTTPSPTPSPTPSTPLPTAAVTEEAKAADTDASDYVDALPLPPVCGNSSATLTRVVGGIPARLGDFPWMALLGYNKRNRINWNCGGSLVSSKHVLTAGHCIHELEKILYVVRLGELDLNREDDGATPVDVLIKKAIKHENYSRSTLTNDIGILVLERDVAFTELIKPICIPVTRELRANTFENYNPMVAGWGALEFRGPAASILQVVQLPVVSNEYCQDRYKPYKSQVTIDGRVLCAGFKKGGKDACQGDSGGPLMQPVYNPQEFTTYYFQIGVVSFGKQCAVAGFPGVYSRVTNFVPWIQEKMLGGAIAANL